MAMNSLSVLGGNFATKGELSTAGGLVHINTTTFSAVSSVSLNNVFSSTYDYYQILCNLQGTNNTAVAYRLRVGGVDALGNDYVRQLLEATGTTIAASRSTSSASLVSGVETTSFSAFNATIFNPNKTVPTKISSFSDNGLIGAYLTMYVNGHSLTTAYDGFTLFPAAGTFTGTIRVSGYKNGTP